jgi:hypothetical protein
VGSDPADASGKIHAKECLLRLPVLQRDMRLASSPVAMVVLADGADRIRLGVGSNGSCAMTGSVCCGMGKDMALPSMGRN